MQKVIYEESLKSVGCRDNNLIPYVHLEGLNFVARNEEGTYHHSLTVYSVEPENLVLVCSEHFSRDATGIIRKQDKKVTAIGESSAIDALEARIKAYNNGRPLEPSSS